MQESYPVEMLEDAGIARNSLFIAENESDSWLTPRGKAVALFLVDSKAKYWKQGE